VKAELDVKNEEEVMSKEKMNQCRMYNPREECKHLVASLGEVEKQKKTLKREKLKCLILASSNSVGVSRVVRHQ